MKLSVLVLVTNVNVEEAANELPSLYWIPPTGPAAVPPVEVEYLLPLASVRAPATFRYPETVRFVLETLARELCPEILRDAPCKNPESVRFVPEALTNVEVWTTSCPKVTRDDVESLKLTRAEETLVRSLKLLAVWRKKLVF